MIIIPYVFFLNRKNVKHDVINRERNEYALRSIILLFGKIIIIQKKKKL